MLVFSGSRSPAEAVSDQNAAEVLDVLEDLGPDPILLVCRTGQEEREARVLRTALSRDHLGVLPLDEPETRFRILAYCLCQLSPEMLAQAPVVIEVLLPALRTRVALTSVSRLTRPAPTLRQHIESLMPGSRFLLDLNQGNVTRTTNITWPAPPQEHLAVWAANDELGRVTENLEKLGIHREVVLPVSRCWPSKSWAEMTILDADPGPLVAEALNRVSQTICPHCGRSAVPEGCLMCGTWPYGGDNVNSHIRSAPPPTTMPPVFAPPPPKEIQ